MAHVSASLISSEKGVNTLRYWWELDHARGQHRRPSSDEAVFGEGSSRRTVDSVTDGQEGFSPTVGTRRKAQSVISIVHRAAGILSLITLMLLCGTSLATAATHPADAARVAPARHVDASGAFTAAVFFNTLVPRPVGNSKCEFVVQGRLTFSGTLEGVAQGTTTALIDAPCAEALNPANLGAFRDVFRFEGTFSGVVAGVVVADGDLSYAGVTRPGGSIDANIKLRADGAKATLHTVTAQLGVGGTYRGVAVTKN